MIQWTTIVSRGLQVTLLVLTSVLASAAQPPDNWIQPPNWTQPHEPFRIGDNLYYVGTAELTAFLIATEEGHILIDAPMKENTEAVLASIRKLGFDPEDVAIQLASHAHFDHTGGLASMLKATGASLHLSREAARLAGNGGKGDFFLGDSSAYPPARADVEIGHLDSVVLGDVTLTAHLTPGHTKGCTSWSGTTVIAGQERTWVSVCSLSVLSGYQLVGNEASYDGIARDFCQSVAHLKTLEPDVFLASHASFIGLARKYEQLAAGDENAFVDPERYAQYLERAERRIEQTLAEQGHSGGCAAVLSSR